VRGDKKLEKFLFRSNCLINRCVVLRRRRRPRRFMSVPTDQARRYGLD